MISDLKPYSEYKESGLDWLGSIPAHWGLQRAKRLFREVDERSKTGKEELLSVSHHTGVTPRRLKNVTMFMAESNVGHKVCRPGDLVINTLWAWMAALGVTRHTGLVSPAYGVYRPIDGGGLLPTYADHLLRTPMYAAEYQRRSTGVNSSRLRLYPEQFLRVAVLVPPLDEQAAIARFLDWTNARLERAIRAKRKVIALLTEQKQAVIQRLMTQGLNHTAPVKPTGIHWLGDMPQHWETRRLKSVLRLQRGYDLASDERRKGTVPVYSSGGHIDNHDTALANAPGIVIGRYGSTHAVFFVDEPYWPHNTALFTTTFYDNSARWCYYLLRSIPKDQYAGKAAVPGVDRKDLFDIRVPKPPIEEQCAIAVQIDERLAEFEKSTCAIHEEIELLREYRTRLVADIVTGKLDVRDAAVRLPDDAVLDLDADSPDEADDPEPLDEEATEA